MEVYLKDIQIFNFKSFRGKVLIKPAKSFTGIIGANGSGKSNVMDAISFVIGEKASNLRVKQLSDLIYGAHIGKPIGPSAYVMAVFVLQDDNEKSFTRTIHHSACEYKINDQVVQVDTYMCELKQLGLNVKAKNFLIFQGATESMVMATPKEKSALLEEISDSRELKAEYERLKTEVSEIETEIQFISNMKRSFLVNKGQAILEKKEADRYEILHKQYLKIKLKFQIFELYHIERDIDNLESILSAKDTNVNKYVQDKEAANDLLKVKKKQLRSVTKCLEDIEQDLIKLETEFVGNKAGCVRIKEEVSYWNRKLESAKEMLVEAHKSKIAHIKTIEELKNELVEIERMISAFDGNMTTQLLSQKSSIEFTSLQVQEYYNLKQEVQKRCSEFMQHCDSLKHEQSLQQHKLDNENMKKVELGNKLEQKQYLKNEMEQRRKKLQQYIEETQKAVVIKMEAKCSLKETAAKHKDDVQILQINLQKVSEELDNVEMDKYMVLVLKKRRETIKILKDLFPGVYGRLNDMCKPFHSRYDVAVTKVLGKHINSIVVTTNKVGIQCMCYLREQQRDRETFLPLDSLKVAPVQERLRDIKEPKNVKLLYDVLQFDLKEIKNAILFATNNTLVCETSEDARVLAYESGLNSNCVALDGTFYSKSGTISGGCSELSKKAQIWEEQRLGELKLQKVTLIEKLTEVSKNIHIEPTIHVLDMEIHGLTSRLKHSKYSLSDTASVYVNFISTKQEQQITMIENELKILEYELKAVTEKITLIKAVMEERSEEIQSIETHITAIEETTFKKFCKSINVNNIHEYEKGGLRLHQEELQRGLDLEKHRDCIQSLLDFETERDLQSVVLKFESIVKTAQQKLEAARQKEALSTKDFEKHKSNLNAVRAECEKIKIEVDEREKDVNECTHRIGIIAKLIQDAQTERVVISTKIEKKKGQQRAIFKSSKMDGLHIPLISNNTRSSPEDVQNSLTYHSSLTSEELNDHRTLLRIDFTNLAENLKSRTEEDIHNFRNQLKEELTEIEATMQSIQNPNFKADEKLRLNIKQLKETNVELQEARKRATVLKSRFQELKQERRNRFVNCLEHIESRLDLIYKCLVNDNSAQAVLLPENPEEPYLGGIHYSCIAPGKRYQAFSSLSGGEKTVAALALLFAINSFKPSPFIVLDEVDAALDNVNISNVVRFIRSKTDNMQFIIISLKRELYSHADALIGVCSDLSEEYPESLVYSLSLPQYSSLRESETST